MQILILNLKNMRFYKEVRIHLLENNGMFLTMKELKELQKILKTYAKLLILELIISFSKRIPDLQYTIINPIQQLFSQNLNTI